VLESLVRFTALPEVTAPAISIIAATPLNFVGNKMWSFARPASRRA
jgi:putative flippase GtrA